MKRFTGARPVRFEPGQGWIECLPYYAQRWQPVFAGRILGHAPYQRSKAAALDLIAANIAHKSPLERNYKLGVQMEKRSQ